MKLGGSMRGPVVAAVLFSAFALGSFSILGSAQFALRAGTPDGLALVAKTVSDQARSLDEIRKAVAEIRSAKVLELPEQGQSRKETDAPAAIPAPTEASSVCQWTFHPGVTVGGLPKSSWKSCSVEGGTCSCPNLIRYGRGQNWREQHGEENMPCTTARFGLDPAPGYFKECQCEVLPFRNDMPLEVAKQKCMEIGGDCKGVTCDSSSLCSPRDGLPYLGPDPALNSYAKHCSDLKGMPGGGLRGKHLIDGEHTIFISMAAFRDRDAHLTLKDMLTKARFPRRVFVGVVCQNYPEDVGCLPEDWAECSLKAGYCPSDQVRERRFHASKAEGPTHARALAASMYRGEDFFMMIDAHNRFVQDWDQKLIDMQRKCPSPKCVLSHYPQGLNNSDPYHPHPLYTPPGTSLENYPTTSYLCGGEFHDRAIIKNARAASVPVSFEPRPQPYTGAGLVFGPGSMIIEAPFDPHLPFLWDGEEFLYTARLWTWGYDLFSPNENILFHHYYRDKQPRVWGEKSWSSGAGSPRQDGSYRRLQYILQAPRKGTDIRMVPADTTDELVLIDLPKYGLGPVRTIDEYWRFARININNRSGDPVMKEHGGFFCKNFGTPSGPYIVPPT